MPAGRCEMPANPRNPESPARAFPPTPAADRDRDDQLSRATTWLGVEGDWVKGIKRVEVVANCASGSVGRAAPAQVERILAEFGLAAHVHAPEPGELVDSLHRAISASPDLLVILAGDGTARAAAELCGPDGPIIAPLPGGTMNMLSHAIYGPHNLQEALRRALAEGIERPIGGGDVE